MSRIDILGVGFDSLTMDEAVEKAMEAISHRSGGYVVTPNPEIVMLARENPSFGYAIAEAELVLADGIGIIYGGKILGTPLRARTPGVDFASAVMQRLAEKGGSVYLFGAKPGVAEQAGVRLSAQYPGLVIAGCSDGYFTDDTLIVEDICRTKPDFLLVCLGAPKQELWMQSHRGLMDVGLMAGLGGSLDVFAGVAKRAPKLWQKLGLEWLYRLLKQPSRIGRMIKLPQFLLCVIKERVKK